ncbi:hypothetical protein KIPB_000879 [Kipferlia bialata]|uniref:Uncharacterized protein n=1 Tax=Kipferlia bialata TaxID=797122 RepID=A0A9K3CP69_9EUKA|nr:hypothetical protein KIPB_000879 [Kipferlia bialata]|eukprot:g879.t1
MFVYSDSCLHVVVSSFSSQIDRVQRHFTYHPDTGWVDTLCPPHSQMPLLDTPRYIQSGKALLVYSCDLRVSHTVPNDYDTGTERAHCVLDIVSGDVYRGVEIHYTQRVEHLCPMTPSTYLTQVNEKRCVYDNLRTATGSKKDWLDMEGLRCRISLEHMWLRSFPNRHSSGEGPFFAENFGLVVDKEGIRLI